MRIAVLVKQVPLVEEMELVDGRLRRDGVALEMNSYCRRAVSKAVELAGGVEGGQSVVFTLGPPSAEDVLREAIAWGATEGVHLCDPAFAGSDTLATARALATALRQEGPWDLVLVGRNSIDADTGQVGPEVAELLDLPFLGGARVLELDGGLVRATCELDDGWRRAEVALPAVISTAERLTAPCKVGPEGRAAVDGSRLRRIGAAELGSGPWGASGSATVVTGVRTVEVTRHRRLLSGPVKEQVAEAVSLLDEWGALEEADADPGRNPGRRQADEVPPVPARRPGSGDGIDGPAVVAVVLEPGRNRAARELLGEAAELASHLRGEVVALVALGVGLGDPADLARWGADRAVQLQGTAAEEDVAGAVAAWCEQHEPWALLACGTLWGREVLARVSARTGAGLTGDAIGLGVEDERLVAFKPAFGGRLVAVVSATSPVQAATVRPGVLPLRTPREVDRLHSIDTAVVTGRGRVRVVAEGKDDEIEGLLGARVVVGVGQGVDPARYESIVPLLDVLGAEMGASRKVTDKNSLPRARQIGITGHSIAPALYIAIGISGKFNHMVGVRSAGTLVVINRDPTAPAFEWADLGIVGEWEEVVPLLVEQIGVLGRSPVAPHRQL